MKTLQNLILFLCLIFALQAHGSNCFLLAGKVFKESQSLSKVLPFDTAQTVGMEFEGVITANMTNLDLATYIGKYLSKKVFQQKSKKNIQKTKVLTLCALMKACSLFLTMLHLIQQNREKV